MSGVVAILGAGAIGAGWAARFALMGWRVRVFDPDPAAADRLARVLDNARLALPGLMDTAMPPEGEVIRTERISQAVTGATWIQESVPDRLELKRTLYQKVQEHCADDVILASSSTVLTPSELQGPATRGVPILVAHPCDPVYLVPMVELVAAPDAPAEVLDRARAVLTGIGMVPLQIRREGPGHVAGRLAAALWREALSLVEDGIATTGEIDAALTLGLGLGWAQTGPFEALRLAAGEAGLADRLGRAMAAAEAPRGRSAEGAELSDELIRTIRTQSDAQACGHSLAELERHRDTGLVALLRALKWTGTGAGAHLRRLEAAHAVGLADIGRPIVTQDRAVPLDWTDYNGHMTESRYLFAFADATDRFMEMIGCDADYIAAGASFFTVETHIRHLAEAHAGQRFRIETMVLAASGRKMHLFHRMLSGERLVATGEHLLVHVSLATRSATDPGPEIARRLAEIAAAHAALPRPDGAGRAVGQPPGHGQDRP